MKTTLALALVMSGCFDSPDPEGSNATLPSDAHYVEIVGPYATPQQCLAEAEMPFSCSHSISLCRDGRAGLRQGDLVFEGTYYMADSVAQISLTSWNTGEGLMQFDVSSLTELGSPSSDWVVDTDLLYTTEQFDNISCN